MITQKEREITDMLKALLSLTALQVSKNYLRISSKILNVTKGVCYESKEDH